MPIINSIINSFITFTLYFFTMIGSYLVPINIKGLFTQGSVGATTSFYTLAFICPVAYLLLGYLLSRKILYKHIIIFIFIFFIKMILNFNRETVFSPLKDKEDFLMSTFVFSYILSYLYTSFIYQKRYQLKYLNLKF